MKRNFKTLIAACMAGTMILLLAACGGEKGQEPVAAPEESTAAPVQDAQKPEESSKDETAGDKYKIGVCFPTSMNEFWQYDVKMMNEVAEEHSDVEILLQVADDDADTQFSQVENLITQGIDALIICPVDTAAIGPALDACHEQGIYVVSLRRIAQDCWIDAISLFDQYQKGYQSAAAAFEAAPKGNYVLLNGDISSLPDVEEFKAAWYDVLQEAIDAGDVNVVLEQYCTSWSSDQGLMQVQSHRDFGLLRQAQHITSGEDNIHGILIGYIQDDRRIQIFCCLQGGSGIHFAKKIRRRHPIVFSICMVQYFLHRNQHYHTSLFFALVSSTGLSSIICERL